MEQTVSTQPADSKWLRLLYMILIFLFYRVAEVLMWVVTIFQVLSTLLLDGPHPRAKVLGASLARYVCECWRYLTYNSDLKPFPFADWPSGRDEDDGHARAQPEGRD
jgi:hypothetical protein